jgi:uncharacterized membrane protein
MDRLSKAFIILAAIGIAVAVYHGYDEITAYTGPGSDACNVFTVYLGPYFSCTTVFASGYATLPPGGHGVPLYVFGLIWFPLMAGLGLWFGRKDGVLNGEVLVPILMVGNIFTFYLLYTELARIHALCPVCASMYVLNYAMTGLAFKALLGAG